MIEIYDYADLGDTRSWDYSQKGITPKEAGINPIICTEEHIDVGQVLIIDCVAYAVCCTSGREGVTKVAYVNQLPNQKVFVKNEEPEDIFGALKLTCPFCGDQLEDDFEMDDEDSEYECPNCGSIFSYERYIHTTYVSRPVKKNESLVIKSEVAKILEEMQNENS